MIKREFPAKANAERGSIEAEGDALARLGAELLRGAAHDAAPEPVVESERAVIVGERPHQKRPVAVIGEILLRRLEQTSAEPAALVFRSEIKLEYLAAVGERGDAIATIAHIAGDSLAKIEHQQARPAGDRVAPPQGPATGDHALQLPP